MTEPKPHTGRRPSIHDVARHAGVSAATVSKVLHGVATVKVRNTERVFAAVAELGYRIDPIAADLRRSQRRIIGAIVPEFESAFFGGIIAELEVQAEQRGYAMIAMSSRESEAREQELIGRMSDWKVAGLIVAPVRNEHSPATALMKQYGMRGVFIDRVLADEAFDTVSADGAQASAIVARELLGAGHRHILVVTLDQCAASLDARLDGFRRCATAIDPAVKIDVISAPSDADVLRCAVQNYFDAGNRPTAIYSQFLKATLVVISHARRQGQRIPQDLSIVAFDDDEWMQIMHPPIAAVVQPIEVIAATAVDVLFSRIDGQNGPAVARLEPCRVEMRGSVARVPASDSL